MFLQYGGKQHTYLLQNESSFLFQIQESWLTAEFFFLPTLRLSTSRLQEKRKKIKKNKLVIQNTGARSFPFHPSCIEIGLI